MSRGNLTAAQKAQDPFLGHSWKDLTYVNLTPLDSDKDNKRRVEGLRKGSEVISDPSLYVYGDFDSFTSTPEGHLFDLLWRKGLATGGDNAGDLGGFDDDMRAKGKNVYINTPLVVPGVTVFTVPIADGNAYNRGNDTFYAAMRLSLSADATQIPPGQGAGFVAGNLPPALGSGAIVPNVATLVQVKEFTVSIDGKDFFTAQNPAGSASMNVKNPHKGVSILNPSTTVNAAGQQVQITAWDQYAQGETAPDTYGVEDFIAQGWTGLDQHILAFDGTTAGSAGEELGSAMEAANNGDTKALRALASVGVLPPKPGIVGGIESELAKLFS